MSTIAERARMEAEQAEAETPDEQEAAEEEEAQPEPEPEPEPEPAEPPMTEQQAEKEFAKLEKLATTYLPKALAITQTLGMPVQPCPLCTFPGLAIQRQPHEVTSDVESAVDALLGRQPGPELLESNQYERCQACNGWGEVLTGAQKDVSRAAMCNECGGKGFRLVTNVSTIIQTPQAPQYPGATLPYTPLAGGVPDAWNRPAGHPHWGLEPSQVGS